MKRTTRTAAAFVLAALCPCANAGAKVVPIEIPDAVNVYPAAMNDKGQVTGYYSTKNPGAHGFIWQLHGPVVTFDVPGADVTGPVGISATGVVTGACATARVTEGFVRAADGTFTTFKGPNGHQTKVFAANRKGWSVGTNGDGKHPFQFFLRSPSGGITEFVVPGSGGDQHVAAVDRTRAIAGDAAVSGVGMGFIRTANGALTMFGDSDHQFRVRGMNDLKAVVGSTYVGQQIEGFVRASDGTVTPFAAPNGLQETQAVAINDSGTIVGFAFASDDTAHSFIRAADGTISLFDVEGAVDTSMVAINNKGEIAGYYTDPNGHELGFFKTP